jgi:hypothetical protein
MSKRLHREALDAEQQNGARPKPEPPGEDEPITAPEPDTLPEEPDVTPPAE